MTNLLNELHKFSKAGGSINQLKDSQIEIT